MQLNHDKLQMSEQVMLMQNDWKREQELTMQLSKDLEIKEQHCEKLNEKNMN